MGELCRIDHTCLFYGRYRLMSYILYSVLDFKKTLWHFKRKLTVENYRTVINVQKSQDLNSNLERSK